MNFLFPILAAILQASSLTLDKVVLSLKRVNFKTYIGVSFPLSFFITLIIFFIFRPPFSLNLLAGNIWWLLIISIGIIMITNLIFYRALDDDRLGEIQTLDLLTSIPVIIFTSIFFTDERNFFVIIPALIACLAVIWSHWKDHHFQIRKHTLPLVIWSLSIAPISASISKVLLVSWNPISLELVRTGVIALLLSPLFIKYAQKISFKVFSFLLTTNILTTIAWILFYFSYQRYGIIYTILVFSLQPLLVYLASVFFLKRTVSFKENYCFCYCIIINSGGPDDHLVVGPLSNNTK